MIVCKECGAQNKDWTQFCEHCGAELSGGSGSSAGYTQAVVDPVQPVDAPQGITVGKGEKGPHLMIAIAIAALALGIGLGVVALSQMTGGSGGDGQNGGVPPAGPTTSRPGRETVQVPNIAGMTGSDAESALDSFGLAAHIGDGVYSSTVDVGRVIRQEPAAGSTVEEGTTVTYHLSLGPDSSTTSTSTSTSTTTPTPTTSPADSFPRTWSGQFGGLSYDGSTINTAILMTFDTVREDGYISGICYVGSVTTHAYDRTGSYFVEGNVNWSTGSIEVWGTSWYDQGVLEVMRYYSGSLNSSRTTINGSSEPLDGGSSSSWSMTAG